ncbi:MAG: hypothetical protein ACOC2Q_00425, partial [Spirochaetota bacterium]
YLITLTSPSSEEQTQVLGPGETGATFSGLELGEWTIRVDARNNESGVVTIATDETTATVQNAMTTTVSLTVVPVEGAGTLTLTLEWPEGLLATPGIVATLAPDSESTGADISAGFTIDTSDAMHTATYSESHPTGSEYQLVIGITDGGEPVWGPDVVAVHIIEGRASAGTYTIGEDEFTLEGSLEVNIGSDLRNPYTIALSGQQEVIAPTDTMTVEASLDPTAGPDVSYEWYLNGNLQADTGNSITIGGDTGVGVSAGSAYRLSLLVVDTNTLSSESIGFRVE